MGITKGEERENKTDEIFETIINENFPKFLLYTKPQIWESQRTPSRKMPKSIHSYIIFK